MRKTNLKVVLVHWVDSVRAGILGCVNPVPVEPGLQDEYRREIVGNELITCYSTSQAKRVLLKMRPTAMVRWTKVMVEL
jgi:hypothetical protein